VSAPGLRELAGAAGIEVRWTGADEHPRELDEDSLLALLAALELPAASAAQRRESRQRLAEEAAAGPALLTADAGAPLALPGPPRPGLGGLLQDEQGIARDVRLDQAGRLVAPPQPGYYSLDLDGRRLALAVAPPRCFGVADALEREAPRAWGLAAQVYALRRPGDGGVGDAAAVAELAARAAAAGGQALGLSPLHAVAPAPGYSPYSPSHRGFLDPHLAAPAMVLGEAALREALARAGLAERWAQLESAALIDWPAAADARRRLLQALHTGFAQAEPALHSRYRDFVQQAGPALHEHALIAARQALAAVRGESLSWRDWDEAWRAPGTAATADFAASAAEAVEAECFAQWLAAESWAQAQARARGAGMGIGLVADLAVGFEPGGGEAWRHRGLLLENLGLGAPPDAFNAHGQQWGVTSYSPRGLARAGYAPFIELLRANLRLGGGIRIDHVLGLFRLWVVPRGQPASRGGYLHYPLDDLLRLVALESWRHRVIVIGEDLGTVPPDLRGALAGRGVLGTDVLLFSRDADRGFLPPARWRAEAVATTTTHDLPPLAGWRRGRDLDWRGRIEHWDRETAKAALAQRRDEVRRLDQALAAEAAPEPPVADGGVELAAIRFVARSPAPLVLLPLEDALGLTEQPNLPGTVDEHPNWRRRLPEGSAPKLDKAMHWLDRQRSGADA
jgi:4-alpha-glucanotransferase